MSKRLPIFWGKKNNITEVNKSKFDLTSFSDEIYNNTVKFLDNYIR